MISWRQAFLDACHAARLKHRGSECLAASVPTSLDVAIEMREILRGSPIEGAEAIRAEDVRMIAALCWVRLADSQKGDSGRPPRRDSVPMPERLVP